MSNKQLDGFTAAVNEQTDARIREIIDNANELRDEILSAIKKQIDDEQEKAAADNAGKTDDLGKRRVSKASLEMKQAVLRRRSELEAELMEKVRTKLSIYVRTDGYKKKLISDILSNGDLTGARIGLSAADMPLSAELAQCGAVIEEAADISIGGYYIYYPDRGVIDDHTLDMRFRDISAIGLEDNG